MQDATLQRCSKKRCIGVVRFTNEHRCEDCWAADQWRFSGRDQSVNTLDGSLEAEAPEASAGNSRLT